MVERRNFDESISKVVEETWTWRPPICEWGDCNTFYVGGDLDLEAHLSISATGLVGELKTDTLR